MSSRPSPGRPAIALTVVRGILPAVLGAVLLTSCGGADGTTADPARTSGSPTDAPTAYDQYVALGDSYTAAPLVPPTDTSTICLRSGANYPALVAEAMPGTTLTDVSCSGATSLDMTHPQVGVNGSVPPQLNAVGRDTDLVTIGLGGNDGQLFGGVLGHCFLVSETDPTGSPCQTFFTNDGGAHLDSVFAEIADNLVGVVDQVRLRAPDARILVVGYPQIVPEVGTCDLLPLADGDYAFGREINERLAEAVRVGAERAQAEYVDVWTPSTGHDICAADPWINGRVSRSDAAAAYHPLAVEQRAVAQLVLEALSAPAPSPAS